MTDLLSRRMERRKAMLPLDVSGSFHVSTADVLRFADGAQFSAHLGQESVLTTAPPAAFGFLNANLVPDGRDGLPLDPSGVLPSSLALKERLVADPAVIVALTRQSSAPSWALLAAHERRLPRLGCPQG
jgi:hypothetical protein